MWVLADPRPGTAAQALGIAERLCVPFAVKQLAFSALAGLPNLVLGASRLGLLGADWAPPWPQLVIAAGRRSAPPALWLKRRGARLVHVMRPGVAPECFDLLVVPAHDRVTPAANVLEILGAPHRLTAERLAEARGRFTHLPSPRVALLVGGPVRAVGLHPGAAAALTAGVVAGAGSVLATTSRRTGEAATRAIADILEGRPHLLHRFGAAAGNPYLSILADADIIVATGDSISMISEALITAAPVFIADLPGTVGARHRAFHATLYAAGQARRFDGTLEPFQRIPLDETARVVSTMATRGLVAR